MAATTGRHAQGFFLETSTDDISYSTIAEVVDADFGGWNVQPANATHDASPDNMTENAAGIGETDTYMMTINFTETQYNTFNGLFRTTRYWRVNFPLASGQTTPARIKLQGFLSKFGKVKFDPKDTNILVTQIELTRTSGRPTYSNGS